ncbi:protein EARLY-RESPONSIVE TO DEHYDRATION 7, chloroplastic-like [Argentina anserina]|uniref:protein EARLY-RESPONSIVE TO DEHYDRATION 7, chloroplastic-like n=1 Tax=Argentina anserina TaxID=57926 RepID=UPI0021762A7C|nr:protein EARLY-RESPONSIVE TO DEHYDRATION 7, chloroplastic-like [Potentilla anserina]
MSSNPNSSLYPQVIQSNPDAPIPNSSSSSSSMYPTVDVAHLAEDLFPETDAVPQTLQSSEDLLITIPGAIVHLIEKSYSIELASGDLTIVALRQSGNVVAVLARVGDEIQWPLAKDESAVKLDHSHYFFSLRVPRKQNSKFGLISQQSEKNGEMELLNYGLTIATKGQDGQMRELDRVLETYSCFSEQKMSGLEHWDVLDGAVARETSPEDLDSSDKKRLMGDSSAAYWTTLAPNVEDYSSKCARMIASGSGQLIRGILWCGDVTVDRLKWGNEFLKKRMGPCSSSEISPEILKRMQRVKKLTKMSEKMASGILSGVIKVSGFFTSAIVNSTVGKKFFSLLPGEIVLASLDGFSKVCDAVEVAGRNVMSTSSVVTTGLVSQRYGEPAAKVTNEGLDAAGHAIGTAWAVFKIRKALNPKSVVKPTTLAKAASEVKSSKLNSTSSK